MVTPRSLVALSSCLVLASVARAALVVTWVGPPNPPVLDTDYTVTGDPAHIVLITTYSGVAVDRWRIGTTDEANIAEVRTAWQLGGNDPRDIRVEVGTISSAPVHDLGNIDIASESTAVPPATWSNVKLDVAGSVSRVRCYPNASGQGGRLSGRAVVRSQDISVHALGDGASLPGAYDGGCVVGSALTSIVIDQLEPNASFGGGILGGPLRITGNLRGLVYFAQIRRSDYEDFCEQP